MKQDFPLLSEALFSYLEPETTFGILFASDFFILLIFAEKCFSPKRNSKVIFLDK